MGLREEPRASVPLSHSLSLGYISKREIRDLTEHSEGSGSLLPSSSPLGIQRGLGTFEPPKYQNRLIVSVGLSAALSTQGHL